MVGGVAARKIDEVTEQRRIGKRHSMYYMFDAAGLSKCSPCGYMDVPFKAFKTELRKDSGYGHTLVSLGDLLKDPDNHNLCTLKLFTLRNLSCADFSHSGNDTHVFQRGGRSRTANAPHASDQSERPARHVLIASMERIKTRLFAYSSFTDQKVASRFQHPAATSLRSSGAIR